MPWSGIKAFCALAVERITSAARLAEDDLERARDPYYEGEKAQANALLGEVLQRSLALVNLLQQYMGEIRGGGTLAGADLRLAARAAQSFFLFPRGFIGSLYEAKGIDTGEQNIRDIVVNFITNILVAGADQPGQENALKDRIEAFDRLGPYLPDTPERHFTHVRLLAAGKENRQAYTQAIETIGKIDQALKRFDKERTGEPEAMENLRAMRESLVNGLDGFALAEMPEAEAALLRKGASTSEEAKRLVNALRAVNRDFPRAEQIAQRFALELARTGAEGIQEAIRLLEGLKEQAFTPQSREAMAKLLGELRTEVEKAGPRAEATGLIQGAYNAVQALNKPDAPRRTAQEIEEILEKAIDDTQRGIWMAKSIGDTGLIQQAEPLLNQMKTALANFRKRM
jgi:hypothetical protein